MREREGKEPSWVVRDTSFVHPDGDFLSQTQLNLLLHRMVGPRSTVFLVREEETKRSNPCRSTLVLVLLERALSSLLTPVSLD